MDVICKILSITITLYSFIPISAQSGNGIDSHTDSHSTKIKHQENCNSTEGTEFYVAFMYNTLSEDEDLKLFATSRYNATVTVSNPLIGWSTNFSLLANNSNSITIPTTYCYPTTYEQVLNTGLIVTSTAPISLFASNASEGSGRSWDAANILPANVLSPHYIIQSLSTHNSGKAEFIILATENDTQVDIVVTANTSGGHNSGDTLRITLNKGQTYQVFGNTEADDFSGTTIDARSKDIAVFQCASASRIPIDKKAADHLYEQAIPIEKWGKKFAVTGTLGRQRDFVKITALINSTEIYIDGILATTLNARESYELTMETPTTSCYIESSNPVSCNLFLTSHANNNAIQSNYGDPAMVAVYPIEQTTDYITFSTVSTSQSCDHFINLVTLTDNITNITIDGASISSLFEELSGNNLYSFARLQISEGTHTITSSGSGFLGHAYGLAYLESYAYNIGTNICDLSDYHLDDTTRVTICEGEDFTWNGLTPTNTGLYDVYLKSITTGFDSLCVLDLTVLPMLSGDTNMVVCDTLLPIIWHDQHVTGEGEYYDTVKAFNGCDSIVTLYVAVQTCLLPTPPVQICDTLIASLNIPDICADDDSMYINISYTKGYPISYNLTSGSDFVAQGFQPTYSGNIQITSNSTAYIPIQIPKDSSDRQIYPRPNEYSIDITILDSCGSYSYWQSQNFIIHYPSWLTLQRWNDVISLYNERYNGGFVFSKIRWFHEGTLLDSRGNHDGYIYQRPTLIYGDAYWAELTRADDGITISTCPIYPVQMNYSVNLDTITEQYLIIAPTFVSATNPYIRVRTNICGEYYIYYVDGCLLDKQNFCPNENREFFIDVEPFAAARQGLYVLVFYSDTGAIFAKKIIVE